MKKPDAVLDKFKLDYPNLFREGCLKAGFYCPAGWLKLVNNLCAVIESHIEFSIPVEIKEEVYVVQCKSKFGFLRFYMNHSDPYINGAIRLAEVLSGQTCIQCGAQLLNPKFCDACNKDNL
jgi:hypothetical protein